GEADHQARPERVRGDVGKDVGRAHQLQHQAIATRLLLDLAGGHRGRGEIGDRRGTDIDIGRQRREHGGMHLRGRSHVAAVHARRRVQRHRPRHQHRIRAAAGGGGGDREARLAAAAVAYEANRIDVLKGRPRADQYAQARERLATHALAAASAATMSSGSAMRPGPDSPSASGPSTGPATSAPRSRSRAMLARVAGCSHMWWFIAGARASGAVVARQRVVTRSSAKPWASLARVSAVAGATRTRVAQRASSICPIAASAAGSQSEVRTASPDSAWNVVAPTKCVAPCVIATLTWAPASRSRRTRSADLYAA